jgi:FtsH-binding integral membrane protein
MFGITSIYAYLFKARLTNLKYTLMMGILGITIASIYNFFTFRGERVYYIITYLSVIFFTGIAGYNIQRLDNLNIKGKR